MAESIGKYEIRRELGKGGFGQVFLAFDPTMNRQVAIKILNPTGDPAMVARFRTEATAAGNLKHPNIITIHEFGEERNRHYLVMEYLEGQDLQQVMQARGRLPIVDVLDIVNQVALGLQFAHEHGVVHRDIKPANIMVLPNGTAKLMDFGIARLREQGEHRLTQTGYLIGTVQYMAPEIFEGQPPDALTDIWAFGVLVYELLTGVSPFQAPDSPSIMRRITQQDPTPIRQVRTDCPAVLEQVVQRLLKRNREERYQSLEDLKYDAEPLLREVQRRQAQDWMETARGLIASEDFERADALVRKILEFDPTISEARKWRDELRRKIRQRQIEPQIEKMLDAAESSLVQRQFPEAIRQLDSALRIDPGNSRILSRLQEIKAEFAKAQRSAQLVMDARAGLEQSDLSKAFALCSEAFSTDPQNKEASQLLDQVKQQIEQRDRQRKLQAALARTKNLLLMRSYEDALTVARETLRQYPDSQPAQRMLAEVERERTKHDREERKAASLGEARRLLSSGQAQEATRRLEAIFREFGDDDAQREVRSLAQGQIEAERRIAEIQRIKSEATAVFQAKDFDRSIQILDEARGLGEAPELNDLRREVESCQQVQREATAIHDLLRAGNFPEASSRLKQAETVWPDVPEWQTVRTEMDHRSSVTFQQATELLNGRALGGNPTADAGPAEAAKRNVQGEMASPTNPTPREEDTEEARRLEEAAARLLKKGDFGDALLLLDDGLAKFPHRKALVDLRRRVEVEAAKARRTAIPQARASIPPKWLAIGAIGVVLGLTLWFFAGTSPSPGRISSVDDPAVQSKTQSPPVQSEISRPVEASDTTSVKREPDLLPQPTALAAPDVLPGKKTVTIEKKDAVKKAEPAKPEPPRAEPKVELLKTPQKSDAAIQRPEVSRQPHPEPTRASQPVPCPEPGGGDLGTSNRVTWDASGRALAPGETLTVSNQGVTLGKRGSKKFPALPFRVTRIDSRPQDAVSLVAEPSAATCWGTVSVKNNSTEPVLRIEINWTRQ